MRLEASIAESKHVVGFFSPKIGDQKLGKYVSLSTYCHNYDTTLQQLTAIIHCAHRLRLHRPASLHPMKKPAGTIICISRELWLYVPFPGNVFEEHCVIAAFEAEGPSQISAESGDQVLVLNKDNSGKGIVCCAHCNFQLVPA